MRSRYLAGYGRSGVGARRGMDADALVEAVSVYGGEQLPGLYDAWLILPQHE